MRSATVLTLALLLAPSDGDARPPPPAEAPAEATTEASTSGGIVTLRTPGPEAILLRGGVFAMGSTAAEILLSRKLCAFEPMGRECPEELFSDEHPAHQVRVSDLWIDRTEVTVEQYRRCVAAGLCLEPPYASGARRFDRPELPVVMVSWYDASSYCAWAGGRLPTEAEWERAAKGIAGTGRRYPWGNVYNAMLSNHGKIGWEDFDATDGFLELSPVGSFPDGRTPDGIDDLAGNVEEWVSDYYAPRYPEASQLNPRGPSSGEERVIRGGNYLYGRPFLRTSARRHDLPSMRRPWRGFRCVRDP
jgi:formylglycine-generating enzyme required for sulfatase activity